MKQKRVFLMCGAPGSGKSTWIRKRLTQFGGVYASRDNIRFALVNEDEEYFSREDEVFSAFCESVQYLIDDPNTTDIYVDATHLNERSRNKTLNQLHLQNVVIIPVFFNVPVFVALLRNGGRTGRARVPDSVVRRMSTQAVKPTFNERYKYAEVWTVDEYDTILKEVNPDG